MARSEWDDDDANWGGPVVIAAGEILWDLFPDGPRLGGAPANFACHAAALGAESWLVSAVGNDERGTAAIAQFGELGLQTDAIFVDTEHPTGTVDVTVDSHGVASFQFAENCAWDHLPYGDDLNALAVRAQALCFGTLGQRGSESRATIQKLVTAFRGRSGAKPCVLDINFRPPYVDDEVIRESLALANILKLNEDELPGLMRRLFNAELPSLDDQDLAPALKRIASEFQLQWIALTLGPRGAVLYRAGGELIRSAGLRFSVKDTVGAGDSFTATLVMGLLQAIKPQQLLDRACEVAAYVCTHAGATPALPHYFRF